MAPKNLLHVMVRAADSGVMLCAHHGRSPTETFLPVSTVAFRTIDRLNRFPKASDKVFGALLVMGFMLHISARWATKLTNLRTTT